MQQQQNTTTEKKNMHHVKYSLSGSADNYAVTYKNKDRKVVHIPNANNSWTYEFERETGIRVYLSAQNNLKEGTVTVTITVDGEIFKTKTGTGEYVIATADGRL